MKIAFISDIHGNFEALDSVKNSLLTEKVDRTICLGDIVGYGANPNECIDLLNKISDEIIAGNHDWASVSKTSIKYFNSFASEAVKWTRNKLTEKNRLFLSSLSLKKKAENCLYVHAAPLNPEHWDYITNLQDAAASFKTFSRQLCFVAHSHNPLIFIHTDTGEIICIRKSRLTIEKGFRYIINVGSVGQPRDGNPHSSYGIYDSEKKEYKLVRVPYDIAGAQKKILDSGLPPFLASRLESGI
jgi:diadenosine tetraphosphatase ApaH/serine/threonine PP2A family protein phosphatase